MFFQTAYEYKSLFLVWFWVLSILILIPKWVNYFNSNQWTASAYVNSVLNTRMANLSMWSTIGKRGYKELWKTLRLTRREKEAIAAKLKRSHTQQIIKYIQIAVVSYHLFISCQRVNVW